MKSPPKTEIQKNHKIDPKKSWLNFDNKLNQSIINKKNFKLFFNVVLHGMVLGVFFAEFEYFIYG
jgi:hypothetical protein